MITSINRETINGKRVYAYGTMDRPLFMVKDAAYWTESAESTVRKCANDIPDVETHECSCFGSVVTEQFLDISGTLELLAMLRSKKAMEMGNSISEWHDATFRKGGNKEVSLQIELHSPVTEQPTVSSKDVARDFGKRHDNVMQAIEAMKKDVLTFKEMFFETLEPDSYGRNQRVYRMNRDGFSLLAMGFTGKDALVWKLKYIEAFNKMEAELSDPKPLTTAQMLLAQAQVLVDIENRMNQMEEEAKKTRTAIQETVQVLATPTPKDWQGEMNDIVKRLCMEYGLSFQHFWSELYEEVENIAKVDLLRRVTFKKRRMKESGARLADINMVNRLSVIAEDTKLRPICEGILRRRQARYCADRIGAY